MHRFHCLHIFASPDVSVSVSSRPAGLQFILGGWGGGGCDPAVLHTQSYADPCSSTLITHILAPYIATAHSKPGRQQGTRQSGHDNQGLQEGGKGGVEGFKPPCPQENT